MTALLNWRLMLCDVLDRGHLLLRKERSAMRPAVGAHPVCDRFATNLNKEHRAQGALLPEHIAL